MEESHEVKRNWHDRKYKMFLLIPVILILFSVVYMVSFYNSHGDFSLKDISLTGGTSVTVYEKTNLEDLREGLSGKLEELNVREISDLLTKEQKAVIIETTSDGDITRTAVEEYFGFKLTEDNSSFEFTGSVLSESFYRQLLIAIAIAFLFMAIVVFIIFRNLVPSAAVIISAFADIFMTLTLINILGIKLSSGGIVALLMLIGYSVDTDILLTNRVLKRREGTLNDRILASFKTGITMTLTSIAAVGISLIIVSPFSGILSQIFTILLIGLFFDIFNTWVTNVSLLKWYMEAKNK